MCRLFGLLLTAVGITQGFLRSSHPIRSDNIMSGGFLDLFGGGGREANPKRLTIEDTVAPSWLDIDERLRALESVAEREDFESMPIGRGRSNHKANIRLFDAPDGYEPEVILYRDTAGWCPYCEKVWLQLEEKKIPYKVEKVAMRCYGEKPASFFRLSPSGGIPIAVIKGRTVSESNLIMDTLETEFSSHKPMLPRAGTSLAGKVTPLLKLERKLFSAWFSWLTSNAGKSYADAMDRLFVEVDAALAAEGGPYFLGDDISLVDIMFTPFLERMAASLPYYKGFEVRTPKYPNLLRWFEAMDTRDAYVGIKSDYYTHCQDLPPQIGRCFFTAEAAPYKMDIDGGAWDVSKPTVELLEPMLPLDDRSARRDAVRRASANAHNLVMFMLRAVGSRGSPGVSAPLADPNASPNESYFPVVDAALRLILSDMLDSSAEEGSSSSGTSGGGSTLAAAAEEMRGWPKSEVRLCLEYVRERVSVPRDMTVHGARQFRAHINRFLDILDS